MSSGIAYKILKSTNASKRIFKRLLSKPARGGNAVSKKKMKRSLQIKEWELDGFKLLTAENSSTENKHIIFLHGGAYIAEANAGHRRIIEKLALSYNFRVTFIDYPLAPEHQAAYTMEILHKAYKAILKNSKEDTFYLFGDSAGGGLALSFMQVLRDEGELELPEKTVLLSPWLDISLSNKEIENFLDKEVLLHFESLRECGRLYAGNLDLKDPRISPIYGNLDHLNTIKVFASNYELLYPDCVLLKEKADSARGTSLELTIRDRMIHDWVILPGRESERTLKEIADFFLAKERQTENLPAAG